MNNLQRYQELKKPLPPLSAKNIYYKTLKFLMNTIGNLSDGISIGNRYGFDSGVMLDYVYKNKPNGKLGIGKIIDSFYLASIGWKGIRERKTLITKILTQEIQKQLESKDKIDYLDIACGGGEYDIQALKNVERSALNFVELRDYKQENIDKAQQNAQRSNLDFINFKRADAFDSENYTKKYDLIVSSGFWEIIEDDDLVKQCLENLSKSLKNDGVLVFTVQPDHPQLEFIARVLNSNTGQPWVMRLRDLELYKNWLDKNNLEYVSSEMEPFNIFGVVVAKYTNKAEI